MQTLESVIYEVAEEYAAIFGQPFGGPYLDCECEWHEWPQDNKPLAPEN